MSKIVLSKRVKDVSCSFSEVDLNFAVNTKANDSSTTEAIQNAEYPIPKLRARTITPAMPTHIKLGRADCFDELTNNAFEKPWFALATINPKAIPATRTGSPICANVRKERCRATQTWHAMVQNANANIGQRVITPNADEKFS
ncbi:MAG: hypothetical protein ACRD3P_05130 [Terriglobales bacterium]